MPSEVLPFEDGAILFADKLNVALGYAANSVQHKIAATDAVGSTTFANPLKFAIIRNAGPNTVYFKTSGIATTADQSLALNSTVTLNGGSDGLAAIYYICATGSTADLRVLGTY